MNSDPYDSAARRIFGMLDATESAAFDEARRHDPALHDAWLEMNRLAAAVAASTAVTVEPQSGQLELLQAKLGFHTARHPYFWFGVTGWLAAAAACIWLLFQSPPDETTGQATIPATDSVPSENEPLSSSAATTGDSRHLVEEIQVLRENLEKFQLRERALFEPVPGKAMPVVMMMTPPGLESAAETTVDADVTALLADALRVAGTSPAEPDDPAAPPPPAIDPTAIPIYDAVRDTGTLVVNHLPPLIDADSSYHLWVVTEDAANPIYIGQLPDNAASGADSFDFSLGSTMILPRGFILTLDPTGAPAQPSEANTVLLGPSSAGR